MAGLEANSCWYGTCLFRLFFGKKAIIEEMEALKKNDTWELITLPRGKCTVGCRWVYTLKHKADGSLETFAPLAKLNSIPYKSFCQLQLTDLGHCISSMSKRPFFMKTSTNRVSHRVRGRKGKFEGEKRRYMVSSSLLGLGSRYEVWL